MVKPLWRLFPASWKVSEAHAEGRGFPAVSHCLRQHGEIGVPLKQPQPVGYRVNMACERRRSQKTCITHSFSGWRERLPLGTVGTAIALKSQLKVTVSPPGWFPQVVKWYITSADYFHLQGAGGLCVLFTSLCTGGKPSGWRSSLWMETLHWVTACSQAAPCPFSQRLLFAWKVFPIRKCGFKWKQYLWGGKRDLAIVTDVFQYFREMKWSKKETCLHLSFGAKLSYFVSKHSFEMEKAALINFAVVFLIFVENASKNVVSISLIQFSWNSLPLKQFSNLVFWFCSNRKQVVKQLSFLQQNQSSSWPLLAEGHGGGWPRIRQWL